MPVIPFGDYLPDLPDVRNPGVIRASNVIPEGGDYHQFGAGRVLSTNALTGRCRGHFSHEDTTGRWYNYAGDATTLYYMPNTTWIAETNSLVFTLGDADNWEAVHWDDKIVFVNINNEPVQDTVGTGAFATFMSSTNKPKAHHAAIIGDFLVLGDIDDSTGVRRQAVTWSALGNHLDFDADATTQAGSQDLRGETSQVNKVIGGGQFGWVFQNDSIWRMFYRGPPVIFQFDQVLENLGSISKRGVVKEGNNIFFLSDNGFYLMNSQTGQLQPIGKNRVDNTILGELDKTALHRCTAVADSSTGFFYFSYPTGGGDPDKIAVYNPFEDRWGMIEYTHQTLSSNNYASGDIDIDTAPLASRNIDTDPYDVDSSEFKGGVRSLAGFNTSNSLILFDGAPLEAIIETGDIALEEGRRSYVNGIRPIVEGDSAVPTVSVASKELLTETATFGTATSLNRHGEAPLRASGRYMKFRTSITGGFDHAVGVEVTPKASGSY